MSSNKSWLLKVDPGIYRDLSKIPKGSRDKVLKAIEALSLDPYAGDIRKIKGEENMWRRRIGRYRFFYEIYSSQHFIHVLWIEIRGSKTYSR